MLQFSGPRRVRRPSLTKAKSEGSIFNTDGLKVVTADSNGFSTELPRRDSVASSVTAETLEKLDITPLGSPRFSFARSGSIEQLKLPTSFTSDHIGVWKVPLDGDDENQSVEAYLTKFRSDYLRRIDFVREQLNIFMSVRLQNDPNLPSNRRYSLLNPLNGYMFASGKRPPTKSKTNTTNSLCIGHIARRKELQEKRANPLDNSIPGAWPDDIKDHSLDLKLTTRLQITVSRNIQAAKMWHNLVCWEETVPEYCQIGDEYYALNRKAAKFYIQEAMPLYRIINKITGQFGPRPENDRYEFVSANNKQLIFNYNDELFKIKLDLLMPPTELSFEEITDFASIQEFHDYARDLGILTHHAPLFHFNNNGDTVPEMVWCDRHGHITGDADLQVVGKRFDMPSIFYALFWGENPHDQVKFIIGLILSKKRLQCKSAVEFREYIKNFDVAQFKQFAAPDTDLSTLTFNIEDYISQWELQDDEHYINYADPNDAERFNYYQNTFMPLLEDTIAKYLENPNSLSVVCHSDLYSLVVNVAIDYDNLAIHAGEDTNQHPGEVGAVLCLDSDQKTYATENSVSLVIALLADRKTLENQVIGVNPAYILTDDYKGELCQMWMDILRIRCLNAAFESDFEFERHLHNIIHTFSYDKANGPMACAKVQVRMADIRSELDKIEQECRRECKCNNENEIQLRIRFRKDTYINDELNKIYTHYNSLRILFKEKYFGLSEEEEEVAVEVEEIVHASASHSVLAAVDKKRDMPYLEI